MSIISLMTDFGIKDGNVGVMKGVMWNITPDVQISDLSHMVTAQNVVEASLILFRSTPFFPAGTVHVVVVDPGVGTARRPMAAQIGNQYFVGPDNGIITMWLEKAKLNGDSVQFVHLTNQRYWLPNVSHVFHGRDIFAPVGAHLAGGAALHELGKFFDDPVILNLPKPESLKNGWQGEIIHIDHFGNLATNIRDEHLINRLDKKSEFVVKIKKEEINGLVNTFGEKPTGDLVALIGSTGNLVISVVNGNAATTLQSKVGETVSLIWE